MERRTLRKVLLVVAVFSIALISYNNYSATEVMTQDALIKAIGKAVATAMAPGYAIEKYDFKNAAQDDPKLIAYIRQEILKPPSPLPYNLTKPKVLDYSEIGQSRHADNIFLHGMRDGFFIEAGAINGERASISLYLEKELGWRGLLIEPIPFTYEELLTKHRRAFSANVALAAEPKASEQSLRAIGPYGRSSELTVKGSKDNTTVITVKAIPLYSLLLALEIQVVDFMSLDIQSFEYKILKTIPWDKLKFRLMCVEGNRIPEGSDVLKEFLISKGYTFFGFKSVDMWFGLPELLDPLKQNQKP